MGIIELVILSIGLAMDAFAVAVCKGLSMAKMKWKNAMCVLVNVMWIEKLEKPGIVE